MRNLRNIAKSIEEQANAIENGTLPNLLNVGYGWRDDNIGPIDLGYGAYHLTVLEARCLVSKLLGAIYALGGNGNTQGQAHEPIEHAFIDALKTGLTFPLDEEQILKVLQEAKARNG
ncbi:hypothetical protein M0R72_01175 [Candidatus Pacearchaeota archaeon]|nr:hypothetical protein [Candidatus Pacearchaeota archaeon]